MSEPDASGEPAEEETPTDEPAAEPEAAEDPETDVDSDTDTETDDDPFEDLVAEVDIPEDVDSEEISEIADVSAAEELIEEIEDADSEELATGITRLGTKLATLRARRDTLESQLKRTQADFQNYKKRMKQRREEEQKRATEDLVERLLDVRDNLVRALDQDEDADIRDGVEATLRQFDEQLERENVTEISPEPGTAVDPERHEVLLRVESDQPEGTIDEVSRPGYEMADKVIRTAQVTVSDGSDDESDEN